MPAVMRRRQPHHHVARPDLRLGGYLPSDAAQKLLTKNTTLKQTAQQLAREKQSVEDCLKGAWENNRFLAKQLAELHAAIADRMSTHGSGPAPTRPAQ